MSTKTNNVPGERLEKCLKEARLSQRDLAQISGYTPQHINSIIKGRRRMTLEAAKIFSAILFTESNGKVHVEEEYLTGEIDSRNTGEIFAKRLGLYQSTEESLEHTINLIGYERTRSIWLDFDLLSENEKKEFMKLETECHGQGYGLAYKAGARLVHEYKTPTNKYVYIEDMDYTDFISELIGYVKFKMRYTIDHKDIATNCLVDFSEVESEAVYSVFEPTIASKRNKITNESTRDIMAVE